MYFNLGLYYLCVELKLDLASGISKTVAGYHTSNQFGREGENKRWAYRRNQGQSKDHIDTNRRGAGQEDSLTKTF